MMDLFVLTEPEIPQGGQGRSCKPVLPWVALPGITCTGVPGACGAVWASTMDRVYKDLPEDHTLREGPVWNLPADRFFQLEAEVRRTLQVPDDHTLKPGTRIGRLRFVCKRADVPDFEWPAIHTILIRREVKDYLEAQQLTGWRVEPVDVMCPPKRLRAPELFEFVIQGSAGVAKTSPEIPMISRCSVCGFTRYEEVLLDQMELDPDQWDGSDFVRFDPPFSGWVFVTTRVKEALEASPFGNYALVPLPLFLHRRNARLRLMRGDYSQIEA